jgi:sugar phosphate isomerase/epimerase
VKLSLAIQTPDVPFQLPVALLTGSLEEKLHKAAGLGADGVELMCYDPASLEAESIRSALADHGLEAAAVASGGLGMARITLLHPDAQTSQVARSRLMDLIEFAARLARLARLGAPVVTIGGFRGRSNGDQGASLLRLGEILGEAAAIAADRGVRLALEPLNRYENDLIQNAAQGLAFLSQINHPALGLLLDTFHVNIEEASWTEPFVRVFEAGKLFHVHLGDNNRLPPGKGLIDFPAILRTLQSLGYQGFLSAELLALPDADSAAADTLAYMRALEEKV